MIVTNERLVVADRSRDGSAPVAESFRFQDVTRWNLGLLHDERPFLVLHHDVRTRQATVPAHHLLWFRWGTATAPQHYYDTELPFGGPHDPVFTAIIDVLQRNGVPEGETIVRRPAGSREQRTDRAKGYLTKATWWDRVHRRRSYIRRQKP
jgi:hypothetical protein